MPRDVAETPDAVRPTGEQVHPPHTLSLAVRPPAAHRRPPVVTKDIQVTLRLADTIGGPRGRGEPDCDPWPAGDRRKVATPWCALALGSAPGSRDLGGPTPVPRLVLPGLAGRGRRSDLFLGRRGMVVPRLRAEPRPCGSPRLSQRTGFATTSETRAGRLPRFHATLVIRSLPPLVARHLHPIGIPCRSSVSPQCWERGKPGRVTSVIGGPPALGAHSGRTRPGAG